MGKGIMFVVQIKMLPVGFLLQLLRNFLKAIFEQ